MILSRTLYFQMWVQYTYIFFYVANISTNSLYPLQPIDAVGSTKKKLRKRAALPPHECLMDALEELAPIPEKFNIIDKIYIHNCQLFVYYFAKNFFHLLTQLYNYIFAILS